MFLDFMCGRCARKDGHTLEERKQMAKEMEQGKNECSCGRTIVLANGRLSVISNNSMKSVLEEE
jgi:hypothetical protein